MSTDKTLADVQPGGRVRLGDQAELDRLEFQAWARELLPCPFCGNSAEFVPYKDNGLTLKCKSMGCIQRNQRTLRYGIDWLRTSMAEHWNTRALSAQPSPATCKEGLQVQPSPSGQGDTRIPFETWAKDGGFDVSKFKGVYNSLETRAAWGAWLYWQRRSAQPSPGGQGDALKALDDLAAFCSDDTATVDRHVTVIRAALAARQPVGEPVEHACTNCDRTDEVVICQTCAGMAWDNGRLHEFHEVRELSTSLGEGVLDHLLPDEWHEKPLLRFQGAFDEGDRSVGIGERCGNVLAADQSGTVLGDYLAARAAKEGGQ
ncbi:hypothetical protein [Stenotrophomonas sp.]|uniref:hypothetical protein n=1 Tax=Stenotrophomonas sp. TaxID=69392 RepID=UPI00374CBD9C